MPTSIHDYIRILMQNIFIFKEKGLLLGVRCTRMNKNGDVEAGTLLIEEVDNVTKYYWNSISMNRNRGSHHPKDIKFGKSHDEILRSTMFSFQARHWVEQRGKKTLDMLGMQAYHGRASGLDTHIAIRPEL